MMKRKNLSLMLSLGAGLAVAATANAQFGAVNTLPGAFVPGVDTPANLVPGSIGDDVAVSINLPAAYGSAVLPAGMYQADSNGRFTSDAFSVYTNAALSAGSPIGYYPYWDDLRTDLGGTAGIYAADMGDRFVIQWNVQPYNGGVSGFPASGDALIQLQIFPTGAPTIAQFAYSGMGTMNGQSATVGAVAQAGPTAAQYGFNSTTNIITDTTIISIVPVATGACCTPAQGCLIMSEANCTGMGGTYNGNNSTCPAGCAPAAPQITTFYGMNNNGAPGGAIYFDVTVGPDPLTLISLDTNTDAAGSFGMSVYTVQGGYAPHTGSIGAWTLQSAGTGNGIGIDQPSPVTLTAPFVLAANTTYGVALVMDSSAHYYTNGTGSNQFFSNQYISLNAGAASNVPFDGAPFSPRVWNGTLYFQVGGTPPVTGACCLTSGQCTISTNANCTAQGGAYQGDNTSCGTVVCPMPPGVWIETGDAGDLPSTAQVTQGSGALLEIRGSKAANEVDMFKFEMCQPGSFSASLVGGASFDTQIFIFRANGTGVVFNDDDPLGSGLQSAVSSAFTASEPVGLYFVAVSAYDQDPLAGGLEIWADTPFGTERAPDGANPTGAVDSWDVGGAGAGNYTIFMGGSCFAEPATPTCYANCDGSTQAPILNVADFGCFLGKFAAGDLYANCDGSTQQPVLNVADFGCFLGKFAAGCQ